MRWTTDSNLRFLLGLGLSLALASAANAAVVVGRVVDAHGRPVAEAEIQVWHKPNAVDNRPANERVELGPGNRVRTDDEGRFKTPNLLELGSMLRVVASREGMLAGRSRWIAPADQSAIDIGSITLRRLLTVSGRVVDGDGRSIADAKVFNAGDAHRRVDASTDADGRFQLAGVPEGQACLFVEKAGFRFTGTLIERDDPITIMLARRGESIAAIETLAPPLPEFEESALARRLLEPYFDAVSQANDRFKTMALFTLCQLDALEALARIETMHFADAEEQDRVRGELMIAAIEFRSTDDWAEIQSLIESSRTDVTKASCYAYAARWWPGAAPRERQQWLDASQLHARGIVDPAQRALALARVAIELNRMRRHAEAEPLAREALALADPLPVGDLVRWSTTGSVAQAIAPFDLAAAQELLGRLRHEWIYAYELGRLACEIARTDAALAERLWNQPPRAAAKPDDLRRRDAELAAPFCYRLARRDAAAAQKVAAAFTGGSRIDALAAVAEALAETDQAAARRLVAEIVAHEFPLAGSADGLDAMFSDAAALARLLPLLERVDPQLGRECLWRAVALRPPRPVEQMLDDEVERIDLHLIGLLSRYDRRLARSLLVPYVDRLAEFADNSHTESAPLVVAVGATIDPAWAARLLERLPDAKEAGPASVRNRARWLLVHRLSMHGSWRWQAIGYRDLRHFEVW
ncbi:MAG TPA: carboxypeptidase-like regulatory domain-containing protein [Pirellulales bacterium]|nr:carboxypeptidase-like regulatory domain-containing protein [Pirellulales bacterium]